MPNLHIYYGYSIPIVDFMKEVFNFSYITVPDTDDIVDPLTYTFNGEEKCLPLLHVLDISDLEDHIIYNILGKGDFRKLEKYVEFHTFTTKQKTTSSFENDMSIIGPLIGSSEPGMFTNHSEKDVAFSIDNMDKANEKWEEFLEDCPFMKDYVKSPKIIIKAY